MIDTSIIDFRRSTHRSSKVDTAIFESRHIDRRSSKVDTSIIDLRKSTHRSSKVDTSIFETRHIDHRRSTHRSSKIEGVNIAPTIRHRILSTTALRSIYLINSIYHTKLHTPIPTCIKIRVIKHVTESIRNIALEQIAWSAIIRVISSCSPKALS